MILTCNGQAGRGTPGSRGWATRTRNDDDSGLSPGPAEQTELKNKTLTAEPAEASGLRQPGLSASGLRVRPGTRPPGRRHGAAPGRRVIMITGPDPARAMPATARKRARLEYHPGGTDGGGGPAAASDSDSARGGRARVRVQTSVTTRNQSHVIKMQYGHIHGDRGSLNTPSPSASVPRRAAIAGPGPRRASATPRRCLAPGRAGPRIEGQP